VLLACWPSIVAAYWEQGGSSSADRMKSDPYTQAMEMSRRAKLDPNLMRNDPDHFKKMFGQLAVEQNQHKAMEETKNVKPEDKCMVCNGVVVEFEAMLAERHQSKKRAQLAVLEVLDDICHLDRYEFQDPVKLNERRETSRKYGGIAPPVFANGCKQVVDLWNQDDDYETILVKGGPSANMHESLRNKACSEVCSGLDVLIKVQGDTLVREGQEGQCADPSKKKKKKKKESGPTFKIND